MSWVRQNLSMEKLYKNKCIEKDLKKNKKMK